LKFERAKSRLDRPPDGGTDKRGLRIADQARVSTAQKPAHRCVGGFARNIPKGDIHRRDGKSQGAAPAEDMQLLLNVEHERRNLRCVLPDAERRDQFVDRKLD
jgi:hypothetical protein